MSGEKQFLSKREVAKLLGLSVYTIDAWVSQRRELPFVKAGRSVRFRVCDVEAWIERNRVDPD